MKAAFRWKFLQGLLLLGLPKKKRKKGHCSIVPSTYFQSLGSTTAIVIRKHLGPLPVDDISYAAPSWFQIRPFS